jgi:hypothetical protein
MHKDEVRVSTVSRVSYTGTGTGARTATETYLQDEVLSTVSYE